ncbi:hypothetical protein P8605_03600 [Streptomyces sp. T-3]|nr:hypothetical protein [Streptomyces sp. T-3]
MGIKKRAGIAIVTTATLVGAAACQSGGGTKDKGADAAPKFQSRAGAVKVLTAAYEKTAAAKSAKVEMTMKMPAGVEGGGDMKMSGVMGWDPTVMDMTMSGSALAAGDPNAPENIRMVWRDNVMYMDMGKAAAADMDGKRWMKMDLGAIAKESGDKALEKQMTGGLENMSQDPSQQMALLLESPNLKHLGSETVDGQKAAHYKGTLTVKEMLEANKSLDVLEKKDRDKLLENIEKTGIEGYDTEVWVNEDNYPVKMDVGMDTPQGKVQITQTYSEYGAKATVEAPPASQTFDLMEMMGELGKANS